MKKKCECVSRLEKMKAKVKKVEAEIKDPAHEYPPDGPCVWRESWRKRRTMGLVKNLLNGMDDMPVNLADDVCCSSKLKIDRVFGFLIAVRHGKARRNIPLIFTKFEKILNSRAPSLKRIQARRNFLLKQHVPRKNVGPKF
jgi:hypothetical protein